MKKVYFKILIISILQVFLVSAIAELKSIEEKSSYIFGREAFKNSKMFGLDLDLDAFTLGLKDAKGGKESRLSPEKVKETMKLIEDKISKGQKKITMERLEKEKQAGKDFLKKISEDKEVVVLPSGLAYKILEKGSGGNKPTATSSVECHYEGKLINGTVFDSSYKRGQTITFGLDRVIKGWTEGVQLMSEGDKFEFYIPSDLAYGDNGAPPNIPGGALLIFKVELVKIK